MYSMLKFFRNFCAVEENWEAESGEISGGYNSCDARPLLISNSATTASKIFESRIRGRSFTCTSPLSSLQPCKSSSSTATAGSEPPTQSAVRACSPAFHKLPSVTKSIFQELPTSESSASIIKTATSSKASVEAALLLNPTRRSAAPSNVTNQQRTRMHLQVEEGKTHVYAIPEANEALTNKENVTLSPSTSKLPQTQSAIRTTASSLEFHEQPTSRKPTLQELSSSKSSTSTLKSTTSSKAPLDAALSSNTTLMPAGPSNVISQQGKAMYVSVERDKTHIPVIPKVNEDLMKKENVTTSFPERSSATFREVSSNLGLLTSTKSTLKELPSSPNPSALFSNFQTSPSESSTSSTTSSKASLGSALSLSSTLTTATPSNVTNQQGKDIYVWVEKDKTPIYSIPKAIENMIKNDEVPHILLKSLSPSTYKDYFAALLYAEDYYNQKWNGFELENVSLELHEAEIVKKSGKDNHSNENRKKENKKFVAFKIDTVPEKRPFLLSRDFVFARPSGEQSDPFKGFVNRVKKSTLLVEFGEDFHYQHHSSRRYDVSISFNRFCLKRAHQAIAAASDLLFQSFIFPDHISRKRTPTWPASWCSHKLSAEQKSAVLQILSSRGPPPYLVEGQLCAKHAETRMVVKEAVVQILRSCPSRRVLICAPANKTCDELTRGLLEEIPEMDMFRANAAFREIYEVPEEILDLSLYEGECFACPALEELKMYRVIMSTFISTFRLRNEGLLAGHFSHIFLVDASSASEPVTMVALSNFATESTTVVVTGEAGNRSRWIRSDIARKHGLSVSYFERLSEREAYIDLDPFFITKLFC